MCVCKSSFFGSTDTVSLFRYDGIGFFFLSDRICPYVDCTRIYMQVPEVFVQVLGPTT